ncbi:hypothetical protein SCOCK_150124 [Actinacidiphila cocklensis]|uniref:Uncharacterized protein n=1 Tax=Actinacidiphila cocklensis TaxID=887465 RepID=A0A9W4DL42_9ACTN|nr:hypothetical protein SCOCK_150124 [Actinacidiphila cocklensis]
MRRLQLPGQLQTARPRQPGRQPLPRRHHRLLHERGPQQHPAADLPALLRLPQRVVPGQDLAAVRGAGHGQNRRHLLRLRLAPDGLVDQRQPVRDGDLDHRHLVVMAQLRPVRHQYVQLADHVHPAGRRIQHDQLRLHGRPVELRQPQRLALHLGAPHRQRLHRVHHLPGLMDHRRADRHYQQCRRERHHRTARDSLRPMPGRAERDHGQRHPDRDLGLQRRRQPALDPQLVERTRRIRQQVPRRIGCRHQSRHRGHHLRLPRRDQPAVEHQQQWHRHQRRVRPLPGCRRCLHRQRRAGRPLELQWWQQPAVDAAVTEPAAN